MGLHHAYVRCLGLTEAIKFLHRLRRFDKHYQKLLITYELKLQELEGVELEDNHKNRLEASKQTVDRCKAEFYTSKKQVLRWATCISAKDEKSSSSSRGTR